jgi:hypothetical protein
MQLDYKLTLETHRDVIIPHETLNTLLTTWLFFGMIQVVIQEDEIPNLLTNDLHSGKWLNTTSLNPDLQTWVEWEKETPEGL